MGAFNGFRFSEADAVQSGKTAIAEASGAPIDTVVEQATGLVVQHAGLAQSTIELVSSVSQSALLS